MDVAAIERTLGALGTAFRLSRLYPPTHPAVMEAVRQVQATLPGLAAQGSVEWRVGSTGLMLGSVVLLPRNTQLAELASLLYSRGIRLINVNPAVTSDNLLAVCRAAMGAIATDDPVLGHVTLGLGKRGTQRMGAQRASRAASLPAPPLHPDALPADVVAGRVLGTLRQSTDAAVQLDATRQLAALAPQILALRDVRAAADAIATLDQVLAGAGSPALVEAIGQAAEAFADRAALERMAARLGEPLVPPPERAALVKAMGAMGPVSAGILLNAFLNAPTAMREPYRAAVRHAADRAVDPLARRLGGDANATTLAAAAELLGLTGSPAAVPAIQPLLRHASHEVREAALRALGEIGGRDAVRLALPLLKDEDAVVRQVAARAIGVAGDPSAAPLLVGRLGTEADQGVVVALLRGLGALGDKGSVDPVAQFADPGGMFQRRPIEVRVAAVEALAALRSPEARAQLERLRKDKEPAVRAAVEGALA